MYISGQMQERMAPVAAKRAAYSVASKAFFTPGAVVNTVGTTSFLRPAALRLSSSASVQSFSCCKLRWGQPTKQSFGFASGFFHTRG